MEGSNVKISQLPPGFRFHPTDEELIMHYLLNQAQSRPCPVSIIPEIDIYKVDPWELPVNAELGLGENEWYFFSPRERKYPNGVRPNRAAVSGYWKATGTDKAINSGSKCVGVKKALVFYKGRPPKGTKTDWIMHEYRLGNSGTNTKKQKYGTSMRLDDWVLCRIYKKRHLVSVVEEKEEDSCLQVPTVTTGGRSSDQQQSLMFPRTVSLSYLLELEYFSSSNVLSDTSLMSSTIGFQTSRKDMEKIQPDNMFNSTKLVTEMSTQHLNLCDLGVFKHEN